MKKVLLIILVILSRNNYPCFGQNENWTEKDWKQYAKAQAVSFSYTKDALSLVLVNEYDYFLDSMALIDVFQPIFYRGKMVRGEHKGPVLNEKINYYYTDEKPAATICFENNLLQGQQLFYYPSGQIYRLENFNKGIRDGYSFIYYSDGKLMTKTFHKMGDHYSDTIYYFNGLISETYTRREETQKKKLIESQYNLDEHKVDTMDIVFFITYDRFYYDLQGNRVNKSEYRNQKIQRDQFPHELIERNLPQSRSNLEMEESVLKKQYFKGQLLKKRIFRETHPKNISEQCPALLKSRSGIYNTYSLYPNVSYYDTLFCNPGNSGILRCAETKWGRLNGELVFYYISGNPLCRMNFIGDLKDGNYYYYFENGGLKERGRFRLGNPRDTTFQYGENGLLQSMTVWTDSVRNEKFYFWEDGVTIQRKEVKTEEKINIITTSYNSEGKPDKFIRKTDEVKRYYFNKEGEEISERQFKKQYPEIQLKDPVMRVQF